MSDDRVGSTAIPLHIPGLECPLKMFVHGVGDKHVSRKIREEGVWEPYETSLLLSLLSPGGVFVDIGANIGYFTVVAASVVGEAGKVFAFEPDPDNFQLLQTNSRHNNLHSRIHAVEAGLCTDARQGQLYLSEDNLGDHQIFQGQEARNTLNIQLLNGSDYLQEQLVLNALSTIDFIKIDTQGSEYDVMAGLLSVLKILPSTPPILIELTPYSLHQAGASGRQLIELLATLKQEFWIVDHLEHCLVPSDPQELSLWCDNVDACEGDEGFMNILVGGDAIHSIYQA